MIFWRVVCCAHREKLDDDGDQEDEDDEDNEDELVSMMNVEMASVISSRGEMVKDTPGCCFSCTFIVISFSQLILTYLLMMHLREELKGDLFALFTRKTIDFYDNINIEPHCCVLIQKWWSINAFYLSFVLRSRIHVRDGRNTIKSFIRCKLMAL